MASQIFYSTNPAEWAALEGIYVAESAPPGGIVGANVNKVAIAGACVRGPVDTPVEITSPARFFEVFGGRDYGSGGTLIGEVWEALLNKPFGPIVVVRACASAAVKASFSAETLANGSGTAVLRIDASSPGAWGNNVQFKVESPTDGGAGKFNLRVRYLGEVKLYENLNITTGNDNTLAVLGDDYANWITLTKLADGTPITTGMSGLDSDGYMNLGESVASFTSVAGADGTIGDTDYTAATRAIDQIANYSGVSVALVAKRANSTINAALKTAAAASSDRAFPIWNGTLGASTATVITDAANYRSDRVIYCYNAPYTLDPETAQLIQVPPHTWMASIMSQTAPEVHVASYGTRKYTAGISKLTNASLTRADYVALRAAGISALIRDEDGNHLFKSGVTTDLTKGLTEIARRRQADYIQLSLARSSRQYVGESNGADNELLAEVGGIYVDWLDTLKRQKRIVKDYAVIYDDSVNPESQLSDGVGVVEVKVDLREHILGLVIKTDISTLTTISENAA